MPTPENTAQQLAHQHHKNSHKKYNLSLLASHLNTAENIGSLFRLSDALGLHEILLSGTSPTPPHKKIKKTARATEKKVSYQYLEDEINFIRQQKEKGTLIIALEICQNSLDIKDKTLHRLVAQHHTIILIVGNEKTGIKQALLDLANCCVQIPMLGENSSMNVASATSIACYEITKHMSLF